MNLIKKPKVPDNLLKKWQHFVDLLAKLSGTPASLITQVCDNQISLLIHSDNSENPFKPRGFNKLHSDLYCSQVIKKKQHLLVKNSKKSQRWKHASEAEKGMTFYLGYPLLWPDSEPFGTICVMDLQSNNCAIEHQSIIEEFQELINNDLMLLLQQEDLQQQLGHLSALVDSKDNDLKEINTALRVLLRQQENERKHLQLDAYQELGNLIEPFLTSLEAESLSRKQKNSLQQLRQLFTTNQQQTPLNITLFSPSEQRVIRYIQTNKSSKEIANLMHVAKKTIDFHRQNIRKKLNLNNSSVNLNTYLKNQNIF